MVYIGGAYTYLEHYTESLRYKYAVNCYYVEYPQYIGMGITLPLLLIPKPRTNLRIACIFDEHCEHEFRFSNEDLY